MMETHVMIWRSIAEHDPHFILLSQSSKQYLNSTSSLAFVECFTDLIKFSPSIYCAEGEKLSSEQS